jgi:YVTN family beta-propeller protein
MYRLKIKKSMASYVPLILFLVFSVILLSNFQIGTAQAFPIGTAQADDSGPYIYVVNQGSNSISVINSTTNQIVATIPVGVHPAGISDTGTYVYVINQGSNTISVINETTYQIVATIPVGVQPVATITITPGAPPTGPGEKSRFSGTGTISPQQGSSPGGILPAQ